MLAVILAERGAMALSRRIILNATAVSTAALVVSFAPTLTASAAEPCSALTAPVYQRVNPQTKTSFLTTSRSEAEASAARGYTENAGRSFAASGASGRGLQAVHQMYRKSDGDYLYTVSAREVASAARTHGYADQGVAFYVASRNSGCAVQVVRYLSPRGKHRLARPAEATKLAAAGWVREGVSFVAGPVSDAPPAELADQDGQFTFAVVPDTQQEVLRPRDTRFRNRTEWLVRNRTSLDLRYVAHSGDVVNWDTPDHRQYEVASAAMAPLEAARIPYSLAIGNHDTAAVCTGGSACDPRRTRALFRDTRTFNRYFAAKRFGAVAGVFERDKVDNSYSTFQAVGRKWMVLNLEMWARPAAIAWARSVVAAHPDHNVMVVTHHYLDASGKIAGTDASYGATSPQYLFDNLIKQYSNIKFVFSGHTGTVANRVDTGVHGNTIHSFLGTIHAIRDNPVRLVTVDVKAGTVKTWVYAPYTNATFPGSVVNLTGLSLVP